MRLLILSILFILITSCENSEVKTEEKLAVNYFQVTGLAQGTTYSIIYNDSLQRDLSFQIDSILKDYDSYLSTYVDTSLISRFNSGVIRWGYPTTWKNNPLNDNVKSEGIFEECFKAAKTIYKKTDGAFNPAIFPLVKYWGFFNNEKSTDVSQIEIDSLLELVNFSDSMVKLIMESKGYGIEYLKIVKGNGRIQLDFNGIAQGHSVDIIGKYLRKLAINNYMIEIGGEVLCKGINNKNTAWQIGIDKPVENSSPGSEGFQMIISLKDKAVATSGSYRKFYEKDGVKYSHTMNPKTGYPVQHSLLSVTVVTDKCVNADGYATAFMVMGMEKTKLFIQSNPKLGLEVYLISSKPDGSYSIWMSNGFELLLKE